MTKPLHVAPQPCQSCPYARTTPAGVWDPVEYRKLALYDRDPSLEPVFLCHEAPETHACRGWVGTHRLNCVAVRLAVGTGQIRLEDVPLKSDPGLYQSGTEAMLAGLRGVRRPSREAKVIAQKIEARRARRKP